MQELQPLPNAWQYHLIWTPGDQVSMVQLWAATRMGTRNLWDSWEVPGFVGVPDIQAVMYHLYSAAVELHERHLHLA